ncbi:hypothetical protein A2164_03035 [Candidatus Curtissbacteria bacterium RBG_13_35_7]|uniref:PsbP C-terminal domain-containing protein n=1 Tax=Candidatus Curtissbacteria bacterium RBG_13_35_7 TaxID=1797705 RepID=A0A1F5G1A1_9BACT|nr:MAG: hypothetical protein A2164_03035 [Candidatus Curtissbacteria bacterium RBG_13_35_7]
MFKKLPGVAQNAMVIAGVVGLVVVVVIAAVVLKPKGTTEETTPPPAAQPPTQSQDEDTAPEPQSQVASLSQTFTNSASNYSINYPDGWDIEEKDTNTTISIKEESGSQVNVAGIVISISPLQELKGSQLSTVADLWRVQIPKQFPGTTIEMDQAAKIGSLDTHMYTFTITNNNRQFPTKMYLLIDDENMYSLTAMVESTSQSKYESIVDTIVKSFKLL